MLEFETKITMPNALTILPTYQCTAACKDCCFGSNPGLKGRIPQDRILEYIRAAAEMHIKLLVFSGGEAFLLRRDLDESIALAASLGLMTRVVSNGYWATRESVALDRLKELQSVRLTEINFSTGDFHQEFVPVDRVINGVLAAFELQTRCAVMVELHGDRKFTEHKLLQNDRLASALANPSNKGLLTIRESPWMPTRPDSTISYQGHEHLLANRRNVQGRKRCTSILSTIIIDPHENVGACCGLTRAQIPELNLGSLKTSSLQELFDEATQDFLKIWIFTDGPEKILAWAAEKDPSIDWENKYAHICHACRALYHDSKVRQVIRDHYQEKVNEVYFRYWLLTEFEPQETSEKEADLDSIRSDVFP